MFIDMNQMPKTLICLFVAVPFCLIAAVADAASYNVGIGSKFIVSALDAGLPSFLKKPDIYVQYQDGGRTVKKKAMVISHFPQLTATCVWKSPVPPGKYSLYVFVRGQSSSPAVASDDFNVFAPAFATLSMESGTGWLEVTAAGTFFGQPKPKLWLQSAAPIDGRIIKKSCSIQTPLQYDDAKGRAGTSCMDVDSGESKLVLYVPSGLSAGDWMLMMDTKIGVASTPFTILPPEILSLTPASGAAGAEIKVSGKFFGKPPPKLWLSFLQGAKELSKSCGIKKPLAYPDAQDKGGMSCMELATGVSELTFFVPESLPDTECMFHLDNGVGESTAAFTPTFYISGKISRDALEGVPVQLFQNDVKIAETKSSFDGSYSLGGLHNGDYTVVPELPGFYFYPDSVDVSVQNSNPTGIDFVATESLKCLVIDISAGPAAESYPYQIYKAADAPPDLYYNDIYKTDRIAFFKISGGSFSMGSPEKELGRVKNEAQHDVTLTSDFYMALFETTQKQHMNVTGLNPSLLQGDMRPVEQVTWTQARGGTWPGDPAGQGQPSESSFIGMLRAKTGLEIDLPTEAQWEYACRAGTTTALNTGLNLTSLTMCANTGEAAWYYYNTYGVYHQVVGLKIPNNWGLCDMHGNVWELALDWYEDTATGATDPTGPANGVQRVIRGAGWNNKAASVRSARRTYFEPEAFTAYVGFRLIARIYGISGTVSGDVSAGVTVTLGGDISASTTTGSGGAYSFEDILNGEYTVTPSYKGYSFDPPSRDVTVANASANGINFTAASLKYAVSGSISGAVSKNVSVTIKGAISQTTTSDGDGKYGFTGIPSGNYTVTPSLSGYVFSPASKDISVYGTDVSGVNFTSAQAQ